MAAKRFFNETNDDSEQSYSSDKKRMKTRPTFASVIKEVVMVNFVQNFCTALEPMLRRVVNEEVENVLRRSAIRSISRSPSLRIQALEPSSMKLIFGKKLSLPIFTGTKIVDIDNNPLQIFLVDTKGDGLVPITELPYFIRVEIVVLDGDFPGGDRETWTSDEFHRNIVRERTGKRPLLTGELSVTMRDGLVSVGDIEFTDNSSWIRSRRFRIGARVVQGSSQGVRIREAMTEPFVVKDHRGELYKKHHPPALQDEVWRLEKIGKDGAFHKKLSAEGINTVQEFLKLSIVDPNKLRKQILGIGMSERMWEVTLKHARTCVLGSKLYISRGPNFTVMFNPICQVVKAVINGQIFPTRDLTNIQRAYIENLIRQAYTNWDSLEEVEGGLVNDMPLLTQGELVDEYPNQQQTVIRSYNNNNQRHFLVADGSTHEVGWVPNDEQVEYNWVVDSANLYTPVEASSARYLSESSSDGDLR